jgi:hypothetical protein
MYNSHKSIYILDNWFVSMGRYTKKKSGFSILKSKQTSCALQHNYALTKIVWTYSNLVKTQNPKLETKGLTLTINEIFNV